MQRIEPAWRREDVASANVSIVPLVLTRLAQIVFHACRVTVAVILDRVLRRRPRWPTVAARALETMGGAFLKIGQALSSRTDIADSVVCEALAPLCDRVRPLSPAQTRRVLREALTAAQWELVERIEPEALASGSVAQLHRAVVRNAEAPAVLKILRPEAPARFAADVAIMTCVVRWLAKMAWSAPFSLNESFAEIAQATTQQLDLVRERDHHASIQSAFRDRPGLLVPKLVPALCSDSVVAMEYVADARRIDDPRVDERLRQDAIIVGLRTIYAMLFEHGIVHCDLHPGNLLITPNGTLVLLDFGYMARMDDRTRRLFASLFMGITVYDAARVARVIIESAAFVPPALEQQALEHDVRTLLGAISGATVGSFQIAAFLLDLFAVQRKHRIRAAPDFTMAITSLLSYEGLLRTYVPWLDFQREALPYVIDALTERRETA